MVRYESMNILFVSIIVITMFSFSSNKNIRENGMIDKTLIRSESLKLNDKNIEHYSLLKIFKEELSYSNHFLEEKYLQNYKEYFKPNFSTRYLKHFQEFSNSEKCSKENCENNNGSCVKNNICLCNLGYANLQNSKKVCNFKESFQKYALILEFVFPIGIGHLYCSRNLVGSVKLIVLFLIPLLIVILFNLFSKINMETNIGLENNYEKKNNPTNVANFSFLKKIFSYIYLMTFSLWFFFDIIMFSANLYKDGWGYDLIKF